MSDLLEVISSLGERIGALERRTPPEPRWAVVVSISPLRVRIETETDSLPINPINAAGELALGARVLTQRYGRHLYLCGPHKPTPEAPPAPFGQVRRTTGKNFSSSDSWRGLDSYSATDSGTRLGGITYSGGIFTVPKDGWYRITASCRWGAITDGLRGIGININGTLSPHIDVREPLSGSNEISRTPLILPTHVIEMSAGDTAQLAVFQNSGKTIGLFAALFTVSYERP